MSEEEINPILEGDFWHHMRNIICNGIDIELRSYLNNLLEVDIAIIPYHLRVKCDLDNLCQMCDKYSTALPTMPFATENSLCNGWQIIA